MSPRRAKALQEGSGDPGEELREHLIASTARLLGERGTVPLTTRDIATAAQVSDGVLYNYFSDKNELVVAALARRFGLLLGEFESRITSTGPGSLEERLTDWMGALFDLLCDAMPAMALLLPQSEVASRLLAALHQKPPGPEQMFILIRNGLAAEQRAGTVGHVDLDAATDLIFGAVAAQAITHVLGGAPRDDARATLPRLARTLIGGLNETGWAEDPEGYAAQLATRDPHSQGSGLHFDDLAAPTGFEPVPPP